MRTFVCMCGSSTCKHRNVFNGELTEEAPKGKWEIKEIEDFKDELIEKNNQAFREDGMY